MKERIEFSKKSGNKDSDQLTKANEKINHLTLELKELKDRFGSMTPRPSFEGCQDVNWNLLWILWFEKESLKISMKKDNESIYLDY